MDVDDSAASARREGPETVVAVAAGGAVPQTAPEELRPFLEEVRDATGRVVAWQTRQDRRFGPTVLRRVQERSARWRATFEREFPLGHRQRVQQFGRAVEQVDADGPVAALADGGPMLFDTDAAVQLRVRMDDCRASLRAMDDHDGWVVRARASRAVVAGSLTRPGTPGPTMVASELLAVCYADDGLVVVDHTDGVTVTVSGWEPLPDDATGRIALEHAGGVHVLAETSSSHFMAFAPLTPVADVMKVAPVQVFSSLMASLETAADAAVDMDDGTLVLRVVPGRILP